MTKNIRDIKLLAPILKVRDKIMVVTGLFKLKAKIKQQLYFSKIRREDNLRKRQIAQKIYELPFGLIDKRIDSGEIIVSLTSYGHRVKDTLPYMLYSLLIQTRMPHKIAVYLDENNWNDDVLPPHLKQMQRVGVDFYYCEDLRSYKKLIPAMQMFPDNPILVCDDDFYYHPQYIEWIDETYSNSDKQTVIGSWGKTPEKKDGKYLPYNQWKDSKFAPKDAPIAFGSGNGTLFPCHVFDKEIQNKEVFMQLCPTADDIWFWAMMERQNIKRMYISHYGYGIHGLVERLDDLDLNSDNLTRVNVIQGKNNPQLEALLEYYKLQ